MAVQDLEAWLRILLFVSPIVLWLVCLFFAVQVFTPKNYETNLSSPELALLAGFVPLVVAVVYYLRLLDGPG